MTDMTRIKYQIMARTRGFTLLELVVVIAIIAVLSTIALDRLWAIQVKAERAAMENVIGAIQSALGMKVAESLLAGDRTDLENLAGSNPMQRLAEVPNNYAGELVDTTGVHGGQWYFDLREHVLVYRAYNAANFRGGAADPAEARFAVRLDVEAPQPGRRDKGIVGARLVALDVYQWIER